MDKKNVIYKSLALKRKFWYVPQHWIHYTKWNVSHKRTNIALTIWDFQRWTLEWWFTGVRERAERGVSVNGYRVLVGKDEKILLVNTSNGCKTMWMYLVPQNYTCKHS